MTTWKDGGLYGNYLHEVTDETGRQSICHVRTRCNKYTEDSNLHKWTIVPWPEGEANLRLILAAPETAEALRVIAEGAIVSPEQSPEKIAEQVLRVLRLVREENLEYLKITSTQQKRAEQAEAALEAIRNQAECYLQPLTGPSVSRTRWEAVRDRAVAAIEATKGESKKQDE